MPALLTSTSMRPRLAMTCSTAAATAAASATSTCIASALPPAGCHRADHLACGLGVAAVEEDDVDAIAGEQFDDGAADAAAAAGDQRHLAGQAGIGCLHACHPVQPEMAKPPSTNSVWPLIMAASGRHSR